MARSSAAEVVAFDAPVQATPGRVLEELPSLEPMRHGWATLAALAIVTGLAAVGLGAWVMVSELGADPAPSATPAELDVLAVLADRQAVRYPLRGSVGRIVLVVAEDGHAALTLDGLGVAPPGSRYAVWVVPAGSATPIAAGGFDATTPVVALERRVAPGTLVAVTLEHASGAERPSRPLRLTAVRE